MKLGLIKNWIWCCAFICFFFTISHAKEEEKEGRGEDNNHGQKFMFSVEDNGLNQFQMPNWRKQIRRVNCRLNNIEHIDFPKINFWKISPASPLFGLIIGDMLREPDGHIESSCITRSCNPVDEKKEHDSINQESESTISGGLYCYNIFYFNDQSSIMSISTLFINEETPIIKLMNVIGNPFSGNYKDPKHIKIMEEGTFVENGQKMINLIMEITEK